MSESVKTIAVTGASGYIASWVVKKLLDHGHRVHATVRDVNNLDKVALLKRFELAHPNQLFLFECDLLRGGFEKAFEGCDVVIHMASPFIISSTKDPKSQFIEPALTGTKNVLDAVNKTESVTQVVMTSSVVSLYSDAIELQSVDSKKFNESNWNKIASEKYGPYAYSKTIAERLAWEMNSAQSRWSLSTILPGFVMGPTLTGRKDGASVDFMIQLLRGDFKFGAPALSYGLVDVRDVAEAHVHAVEREHDSNRFICVRESRSILEISTIVQQATEGVIYPLPDSLLPNWLLYLIGPFKGFSWKYLRRNLSYQVDFDNSKVIEELGVVFRPLEDTFRDMALQFERDGMIR